MNNQEIWKDVPGNPFYQVSNLGRIKSFRNINRQGKILTPGDNGLGYMGIKLNGKKHYIHRLVAEAFIPNPGNKREINHLDFNRSNNSADNLEWVSTNENRAYSKAQGRKLGRDIKLDSAQRQAIRNRYANEKTSYAKLASQYNVGRTTIFNAIKFN